VGGIEVPNPVLWFTVVIAADPCKDQIFTAVDGNGTVFSETTPTEFKVNSGTLT
jgi:hypothetical protein